MGAHKTKFKEGQNTIFFKNFKCKQDISIRYTYKLYMINTVKP